MIKEKKKVIITNLQVGTIGNTIYKYNSIIVLSVRPVISESGEGSLVLHLLNYLGKCSNNSGSPRL
jgi:hypothetical protein